MDGAAPRVRPRRRAPTPSLRPSAAGLRRHPARIVSLAGAALLLAATLHLLLSTAYRVYGATVTGNRRLPAEVVYAASGLDGASVFRVDPAATAARIMDLDDVRRAEVRLALPARVRIAVEETTLVLLWNGPARLAVDDTGRAVVAPADVAGLLPVTDESAVLRQPGERLPAGTVEAALAYGYRFGSLRYRSDVGFLAVAPDGYEVRLGADAADAERRLALLEALEARLAPEASAVEVVDVRFMERPYYRLRGGGP
jgi:cell division septal protein FtsQ